jgi:hypothetical protein
MLPAMLCGLLAVAAGGCGEIKPVDVRGSTVASTSPSAIRPQVVRVHSGPLRLVYAMSASRPMTSTCSARPTTRAAPRSITAAPSTTGRHGARRRRSCSRQGRYRLSTISDHALRRVGTLIVRP